jgi:hypothetical protein
MHNGELQRGYVHKNANKMWTIKYVNEVPTQVGSRDQVLGEEAVDLQTLNQRIETRCRDDFPGTTSAGSVFSSTVEQDTKLQTLPKGTTTSNLFGILLSDALFTILPENTMVCSTDPPQFILTHRNLSHDFIGSIKRVFWRRNCKCSCEDPKVLVERLYFVYKFFSSTNNPHQENGKVLVDHHRDIFYKEIKHVPRTTRVTVRPTKPFCTCVCLCILGPSLCVWSIS